MIFHSVDYFVFFAVVYAIYVRVGHRAQNRLLLVASYFFYGSWDWRFLSLLMLTTVWDHFCARAIHASDDKTIRKRYLRGSLAVNLGILGLFKYFEFFADSLIELVSRLGFDVSPPVLNILLPVGVSFYTFQSMGYVFDVYRRQLEPSRSLLDYALYVSFFPQLVAGPIERAGHLLPQVISPRVHTAEQLRQGAVLVYFGLFKKLFMADNLATIVDPIFAAGGNPSGAEVLVGGYAFVFQVYCDFSAYTDIARGSAKLLGFELMENFRQPYLATNLQDYWNRWHISLTTWIRDYLYYPLAFARFGTRSFPASWVTVITFTIMGLWHGAAWGFVLWGVYHGSCLVIYSAIARRMRRSGTTRRTLGPLRTLASVLVTLHVILIGEIFFRSGTTSQAFSMIWSLFTNFAVGWEFIVSLGAVAVFIWPMLMIDLFTREKPLEDRIFALPVPVRYVVYYAMCLAMVKFGASSEAFFYFQF